MLFFVGFYSFAQATDEGYVEDINGILNTGDLPNLYQLEDKATIMENMANVAKQVVSLKLFSFLFVYIYIDITHIYITLGQSVGLAAERGVCLLYRTH